jgi:IMP cyclohydrolase
MSFDDEIDELKKKFLESRLEPEEVILATQDFERKLTKQIKSQRLKFDYEFDDEDGPRVEVIYAKAPFHIGTVFVQGNGTIAFASESEYFPPLVAYENENEFFKEAKEFLKEGLAAFELDEEEDAYEA